MRVAIPEFAEVQGLSRDQSADGWAKSPFGLIVALQPDRG